ncbi:HEAT repeat domain-containing protein [Myxococcus sp. K38C18041901]|uniref:HEAT repeat domain-containing protein n=1 Tax=Myxococcus guangdongensis TaxID=2906760 RepID=UPI0020A7F9D8|nr:HEAT repeat domain-containing protein [Myxococcus guangdongensis]MCP3064220.1 HEAT repeat domain-containing protein [Myxococcus guangdongensis]
MKPDRKLAKKLDAIVQGTLVDGRAQTESLVASVVSAGGTSEQALIKMLGDSSLDPELRADICWLIPRLELDAAQRLLEPLMSESSDKLREEAAVGLGLVAHDSSIEVLLKAMEQDASRSVRRAALHALGIFSPPRAAAHVMKLLLDPREDEEMRAEAAEALAHFRHEGVVEVLIGQLRDASAMVRYSAAYSLGQQGDAKAIEPLREVSLRDHAATPWGSVSSSARSALEELERRDD